jgi:hypothetical protein
MPALNKLLRLLQLRDYSVRHPRTTRNALIAFNFLITANLIAELTVDMLETPVEFLFFLWVAGLLLLFLHVRWPSLTWPGSMVIILTYAFLEVAFLVKPIAFITIHFWLIILPIAALVVLGVRASLVWIMVIATTFFANNLILKYQHIDSLMVVPYKFIIMQSIYFSGILIAIFFLFKIMGRSYEELEEKAIELRTLQEETNHRKKLLEQFHQSILSINRSKELQSGDAPALCQLICHQVVRHLRTNRVSIWHLEHNNQLLVRKFLHELDGKSDEIVILPRTSYPTYFRKLEEEPYIMAHHARTDPATCEFTDTYLVPLDIHSMLDCPIRFGNKVIGVICCEHQFEMRTWLPEEALYVQSVADILAIYHQNEEIKKLLDQLSQQNQQLIKQNQQIETINRQLSELNQGLEEMVKKRTEELERQNTQLTEYAFINSHLLRAPLARIMGLAQLAILEVTSVQDKQIMDALLASSRELDDIIKKITDLLYEGNEFSREDVQAIITRRLGK